MRTTPDSTFPRHLLALAVAFAMVSQAKAAFAQWVPNGAHVTARPYVQDAAVCGDGNGGAFVLAHYFGDYPVIDVVLARLTANGEVRAGWPTDGIVIDGRRQADDPVAACLNRDGSVTCSVFAAGATDFNYFSTRYAGDGHVIAGWDAATHLVTTNAGYPRQSQILAMPDGSNLFATALGFNGADIWLSRFDASGLPSAGWTAAGHEVAAGSGYQDLGTPPSLFVDGADGAWLVFDSESPDGTDSDVNLQHVDGLGNPVPGWPIYGRSVTPVPGRQVTPAFLRNPDGTMFVAWSDARSGFGLPDPQVVEYYDIYLQRFTADGSVSAGWPEGGLPICIWPGAQGGISLTTDGQGGAYVSWGFGGGPRGDTFHVQHVRSDATLAPGWPEGGQRPFAAGGRVVEYDVCSDQRGGIFAAAHLSSSFAEYVWVQHMTGEGSFDWPSGYLGLNVVDPSLPGPYPQSQGQPRLVPSFPGNAIVFWNDYRDGFAETYASLLSTGGVVATAASLVDQIAAADHVALTWRVSDGAGVTATIERRAGSEAWVPLGTALPDGTGIVRYDDRTVTPGAHYTYRLAWGKGADVVHSSETEIVVPLAFRFALTGATPNPSPRANLRVAFSLAARGAARLELFDAQGRNVATRDVTSERPGVHTVALDQARSLGAGLYWARLTQGAKQATARVVLID